MNRLSGITRRLRRRPKYSATKTASARALAALSMQAADRRQLARVPAAAQRFHQRHRSCNLTAMYAYRGTLVIQRSRLHHDDIQITDDAGFILVEREIDGLAC